MSNTKFLWKYIRPIKWLFIMTTLALVSESLTNIATVGMQQKIIDQVLLKSDYGKLPGILLLTALIFIANTVLNTLGPHLMHMTYTRIDRIFALDFLKHFQRLPQASVQKERTGTYVHYVTNDLQAVGWMIGEKIPRTLQHTISTITLMVIVGSSSPVILLFSLLFSLSYVLLIRFFHHRNKEAAKLKQESRSNLLVHIEEGISSTREVIAYHRIEWEKKIYNRLFRIFFDSTMKEGRLNNLRMISSEPLKWSVTLFMLGYGGYLVLHGRMTLGVFVMVFQLSSQLVGSFQASFDQIMGYSATTACLERVRSVVDQPLRPDGTKEIHAPVKQLQFHDVAFCYPDQDLKVLNGLTFDIHIGQKTALVGMSGGGKSTVTQLLIRAFEPDSGHILINGTPLEHLKRENWMKKVAIVFQEPYLFPDSIRRNIVMGQEHITDDQLYHACKVAQIHDYFMSLPLGYDTIIGERGITLSGGQRQRLAIARALLRDPEILILDEATSALDLITERELQQAIDRDRQGKTTIVVAHRLSTVENADVIYVFDQGRVVEQGTHSELMAKPTTYRTLVYSQESEKWQTA